MKIRTNIVLLIIIFLFSCDKDNNNSSNVFRYNEYSNISSLDPAFSSTLRNIWPCNQIFNGLVKMDKNLDVIPDIANISGKPKLNLCCIFINYLSRDYCLRILRLPLLTLEYNHSHPSSFAPSHYIFVSALHL